MDDCGVVGKAILAVWTTGIVSAMGRTRCASLSSCDLAGETHACPTGKVRVLR